MALDPQREYPSAPVAWGAVILLFGLFTISFLDRNLMALFVPHIKAHLDISDVEFSVLFGLAFALFYAVGALPLGWAIDRFSRRAVIWSGVTAWSFATMGCGLASSYGGFFAARAVVGSGEAVLTPGSQSLLPDMFPRDKLALPMSVYALGSKAGSGLALIVGGALAAILLPGETYQVPIVGELMGWQAIFVIAGIPGLVFGAMIFLIRDPGRNQRVENQKTNYVDYLRYVMANRRFIFSHHLATLPLSVTTMGIYTWTPSFLERVHHWPADKVGVWFGMALALGPTITVPLHGLIVDRLFRGGMRDAHLRYLVVTLILSIPVILSAYLVDSAELCVVLIGLFFLIMGGYISLPATILQIVVPAAFRGKAASVKLTLLSLSSLTIGPLVVAVLTEHVFEDPNMVGWSIIVCAAFGVPLSVLGYMLSMAPAREMVARVSDPSDVAAGGTVQQVGN